MREYDRIEWQQAWDLTKKREKRHLEDSFRLHEELWLHVGNSLTEPVIIVEADPPNYKVECATGKIIEVYYNQLTREI